MLSLFICPHHTSSLKCMTKSQILFGNIYFKLFKYSSKIRFEHGSFIYMCEKGILFGQKYFKLRNPAQGWHMWWAHATTHMNTPQHKYIIKMMICYLKISINIQWIGFLLHKSLLNIYYRIHNHKQNPQFTTHSLIIHHTILYHP